jgi:signal transduction histidine kinase
MTDAPRTKRARARTPLADPRMTVAAFGRVMSTATGQEKVGAGNAMPASATVSAADRHRGLRAGCVSLRVAPTSESAEHARSEGEERFAAYIAHELRNPLATQRALLELSLTDPLADTTSWRAVAEDVLEACMQQERLLEACLTLARSRCGLTRHDRIDLAAIADEALRTHDRSGLASVVALAPAGICGDRALVERLAANLVSNAIRHNFPGGRIEVGTRTQEGQAILVVANSGPLVPAGELGRLFQPFHRLDSQARPSGDGIGLGLPIVRAIAGAHNANLTAEALSGGGLKIDVRFPAVPSGGWSAAGQAE